MLQGPAGHGFAMYNYSINPDERMIGTITFLQQELSHEEQELTAHAVGKSK